MKNEYIALAVIAVIAALFVFGACASGYCAASPSKGTGSAVSADEFAQCLTDRGVVMYGAYWCSHCQNQKDLFGDAFELVNYVECTENAQACTDAGISGYPTWVIDGNLHPGEMTFDELGQLTGC